jgi:2'-5' RNA ligase
VTSHWPGGGQAARSGKLSTYEAVLFPFVAPAEALVAHVSRVVASHSSFAVTITHAVAHRDQPASGSHLFLVPDEGAEPIRRLHDDLYSGMFREHLRADRPYLPHITVGAGLDPEACSGLAWDLNRRGLCITARVEAVEVVSVSSAGIMSVAVRSLPT